MSFFKQLFATPKNPYIPGWDQIDPMEVEFSGCKLRLDLPPRSDPDFKDILNNNLNIYDDIYEDLSYLPWYSQSNIARKLILRRSIIVKGKPWKKSELCSLDISAVLSKVVDLPDTMSCFNPEHFMQVIDKDIFFCYGPNSTGELSPSVYASRCNWQQIKINNVQWLSFETIWNLKVERTQIPKSTTLVTPIENDIFLLINFRQTGTYDPIEDCLLNYRNILETLTPQIYLKLSPTLAKQQLAILQKSGSSYPEKREPISWKPFYIEGWHKDISQKDGEKLLPYPIPQYDPNLKPE